MGLKKNYGVKMGKFSRIAYWFFIGLFILITITLIALPHVAVHFIEKEYNAQSPEHQLDIGSLGLNVFTTTLSLKELNAEFGEQKNHIGELKINVSLWGLFSKTLHIEKVTLKNIKLDFDYAEDSLNIAGFNIDLSASEAPEELTEKELKDKEAKEEQNPEESGWSLKLGELEVIETQLGANAAPFNAEINLTFESLKLGEFDTGANFSVPFESKIKIQKASYEEQAKLIEPLMLELSGMFHWQDNSPNLKAKLTAKNLFVELPKQAQIKFEQLDLEAIDATDKTQGFKNLVLSQLRVLGVNKDQKPDENAEKNQRLEPTVAFNALTLKDFKHNEGNLSLDSVLLESLKLDPAQYPDIQQSPLPVTNINSIEALKISFKDKKAELETFKIKDIKVTSQQADMLNLKQYLAKNISYSENRLELGVHHFSGLEAWFKRTKTGEIAGLPKAQKTAPKPKTEAKEESKPEPKTVESKIAGNEEATQPVEENEKPFSLAIKEFSQADKSTIHWLDEAVKPKVKKQVHIETLFVKDLDTANKNQPVRFEFLSRIGKFNTISLKAQMALKEKMDGKVLFNIDQLDLPPLSAYVRQGLGYDVNHGMLWLKLDSKIKAGKLAGKGKLTLANSDFEPADKRTIERLSKQLSIPLDTALDLLSDGDKKVEVDFPIAGDVSNPSIGIGTIFTQITQDVLVKATITYLKYFFNPFGAVIAAAEVGDALLFSINLKPLKFSATPMTLTNSHKRYLDDVASMMKKQKSLQLKACPFVVKSEGWQKQGTDIANEVKTYLSEKEKTLSARVFICTPKTSKSNQVLLGF